HRLLFGSEFAERQPRPFDRRKLLDDAFLVAELLQSELFLLVGQAGEQFDRDSAGRIVTAAVPGVLAKYHGHANCGEDQCEKEQALHRLTLPRRYSVRPTSRAGVRSAGLTASWAPGHPGSSTTESASARLS